MCSENKGADQLRSYCADLRLCFSHRQKSGFLTMRLIYIFRFYKISLMCFITSKTENEGHFENRTSTHLSLASLLWDIGKQNSPRRDAAERGVPSGAIMFA